MAAVSVVNLVIQKGTDFEETFSLTAEDGLGLNLTGQSATAKLKKYPTSSTSYNFTTTLTVADSTVKIAMSDDVTATLPSGRCYYDIVLTSSGGAKSKVLQGNVIVEETAST
jgi:hypothetical protein